MQETPVFRIARVDPDDRATKIERLGDCMAGAADSGRRDAVPDADHQVRLLDDDASGQCGTPRAFGNETLGLPCVRRVIEHGQKQLCKARVLIREGEAVGLAN